MVRRFRDNCNGCGVFLIPIILITIFNIFIGAWSIGEILSWGSITLSFYLRALLGLFIAEFTVPIAFIGWVIRHLL